MDNTAVTMLSKHLRRLTIMQPRSSNKKKMEIPQLKIQKKPPVIVLVWPLGQLEMSWHVLRHCRFMFSMGEMLIYLVAQMVCVHEIPIPQTSVITPTISFPRKINPLWVAKLHRNKSPVNYCLIRQGETSDLSFAVECN
jgi:hypothetical protein